MATFEIFAASSVFRALDDLSDEDYDLVAAAIFALAVDAIPAQAIKLRMPNARLSLSDGTMLAGPFFRIRCRSAGSGQRGGFRIIYVVDSSAMRVCVAKVARRDDDTYKALERVLRSGRIRSLSPPTKDP